MHRRRTGRHARLHELTHTKPIWVLRKRRIDGFDHAPRTNQPRQISSVASGSRWIRHGHILMPHWPTISFIDTSLLPFWPNTAPIECIFLPNTALIECIFRSLTPNLRGATFEVGGKGKGAKQLRDAAQGFVVKDDIEYGHGNVVPPVGLRTELLDLEEAPATFAKSKLSSLELNMPPFLTQTDPMRTIELNRVRKPTTLPSSSARRRRVGAVRWQWAALSRHALASGESDRVRWRAHRHPLRRHSERPR